MPAKSPDNPPPGDLTAVNREFYDALWAETYVERPERFNTWGLVAGLLSGRFVPLALFPPELAPLLAAQPWRFTLSFPLEVVTASLSAEQLACGFGLQLAYIAGLAALIRVVWRYGLRSYAATKG